MLISISLIMSKEIGNYVKEMAFNIFDWMKYIHRCIYHIRPSVYFISVKLITSVYRRHLTRI